MKLFFLFSLLLSSAHLVANPPKLERLLFASCNKHLKEQPLWKYLAAERGDLFIWGGDNVYADGKGIEEVQKAYAYQNLVPDYVSFKSITPILGIWDDHDYGKNNGGHEFTHKRLSQKYALDFFGEPAASPRRKQEGLYASYSYGEDSRQVKVILLDSRYFKDSSPGSLLGESQWKWLENELLHSKASLHLIVSSISVLTPKTIHTEEWADYPAEKIKLKHLLRKSGRPYLYLAGDRHFSDIFTSDDELEFLSSGMTHNTEGIVRPLIRAQYPHPVFERNYGVLDILWKSGVPVLEMFIGNAKGERLNFTRVSWNGVRWVLAPHQ
jgi:alkaline phosphatase D